MSHESPSGTGEAVDPHDVLERVLALPISTWRYHWEDPEVRHVGPMAQDFHDAFGLGGDPRRIDVGNGLGVALAAIQALHELVERQAAEVAELRERLDRLVRGG